MLNIHQKIELTNTRKKPAPGLKEGQALSKKLLQLWSLGKLSSSGLQEIAFAATADGLQCESIVELSGLGFFGQYPSNCHRDLVRLLRARLKKSMHGGLQESPTISIQVPALDAKEENPETKAACYIVLPHLLVWQLFSSYPKLAPSLFGLHKLKAFWGNLKNNDPRLWDSGLKESQKHKIIPL